MNTDNKNTKVDDSDEYFPYGHGSIFQVWTNEGNLIEGHMMIKKSYTKEQKAYNLIDLIVRECRENNLSVQKTLGTIINNLKLNDLLE